MSNVLDDERGPGFRSALARVIGVGEGEFRSSVWGREPLLTRAGDLPSSFADLMSVDSIDELIAERGVRTPFVRMAKDGALLPNSSYTSSGGFGAEMPDQLDSAAVLSAFADGNTLVLQGLHRVWPPLIDFVGQLVGDLGHPAQVNAYVTPASSQGFDPHYDVHDVFVLQISGDKRWIIHAPVHSHPLPNQPWSDRRDAVAARALEAPVIDTVLHEGDSLYIPRGWIHSAKALGNTTVHLTMGVAPFSRYDLVHHLLAFMQNDAALREPLPAGIDLTDPDTVAPHVHHAIAHVLDSLGVREPADDRLVAERVGARFTELTRPEPVRPLRTAAAMAQLSGDDTVVWRRGLVAKIIIDDTHVHLKMRKKIVSLPAACTAALTTLQNGKSSTVNELVDLDEPDSIVVVRRLLREGVLVLAS